MSIGASSISSGRIAKACGRAGVTPGETVICKVDLAMMHDSGGPRRVKPMLERLERSEKRRRPSDAGLKRRAAELSSRYLGGLARPETVRWVDNQGSRWGSCTPADRAIRLSRRLEGMPSWVIDYVLVHELMHIPQPNHGPRFWRLVEAVCPEFRAAERWLKTQGRELF